MSTHYYRTLVYAAGAFLACSAAPLGQPRPAAGEAGLGSASHSTVRCAAAWAAMLVSAAAAGSGEPAPVPRAPDGDLAGGGFPLADDRLVGWPRGSDAAAQGAEFRHGDTGAQPELGGLPGGRGRGLEQSVDDRHHTHVHGASHTGNAPL